MKFISRLIITFMTVAALLSTGFVLVVTGISFVVWDIGAYNVVFNLITFRIMVLSSIVMTLSIMVSPKI